MATVVPNPPSSFIWPELNSTADSSTDFLPKPLDFLLESSEALFGVIYDLNKTGSDWLKGHLSNLKIKTRIIILLYPGCPTKSSVLKELLDLKNASESCEFRLLPEIDFGSLSNTLYFMDKHGKIYLSIGPTPNFGLNEQNLSQANFVLEGDVVLVEAWRNRFNSLWDSAFPLTIKTAEIPPFSSSGYSEEVKNLWSRYLENCQAMKTLYDINLGQILEAENNIKDGELNTNPTKSVTDELNIPVLDQLALRITALFQKGSLANFDKLSRIPPLDAPIKASWFGIESFRQVGSISRETKYRISVLEKKDLKEIENKKQAGRRILNQLSYPLSDGVRWIPHSAKPILEREMTKANNDGIAKLTGILKEGSESFITNNKDRIVKDANQIYKDYRPGKNLSTEIIDEIITEVKSRLEKALSGKLLPNIVYNPVSFKLEKSSEWKSDWGQPLLFLHGIAEFPRKSIADQYFLRGLHEKTDDILISMNVCNDSIVEDYKKHNVQKRAQYELSLIENIIEWDIDARGMCGALLLLMDGKIIEYGIIGASKLAMNISNADWTSLMLEECGPDIKPYLEAVLKLSEVYSSLDLDQLNEIKSYYP